ncbi:18498_t:CDS:2 [Entrophospora sp. SA101]|nr:18498_t:CDS:2 [Entrophospora sp. SA101]
MNYIINPFTNRSIRVGGPKYMEHIKAGPEDDKESDVEESEEESTCEVDRNTVEQYGNDLFEIGVVIYDQNMLYKEKQQQLQTEQNKLHDTQEYLACDCNLAKLCKIVPQFPLNQQIAPVLCIFVRIVLKLMEAISVKEWGRVIREKIYEFDVKDNHLKVACDMTIIY